MLKPQITHQRTTRRTLPRDWWVRQIDVKLMDRLYEQSRKRGYIFSKALEYREKHRK